nr:nucleic acid-binding, OB-fold protein [Tanacetum cinerariifolium]
MSGEATGSKHTTSNAESKPGIEIIPDMSDTKYAIEKKDVYVGVLGPKPNFFLDQLGLDVTGIIIVMIGRGQMIHCSARASVAYNFLRLREGGIYSVKIFMVYLSSTLSTMILDDAKIPVIKALTDADSGVELKNPYSATFHCTLTIDGVRTKTGWNFPSYGSEDCRKSDMRQKGYFYYESCNRRVNFPMLRYRLELDVSDGTAIETTNEGTKILAIVDGKPRTIFESSIRRNLKINDEERISSLPDTELFENLALIGYNILPNQRFTFQNGQFSHQWKFLIHTIMQCLSPKSTGFNEFSSNIATAVALQSPHHDTLSPSHPTATSEQIPTATPTEIPTLRQNSRRATRIAQSKALSTAADDPASLLRDDSQEEAFPTTTSLDAKQDRETIIKTSTLPHESTPRVTSLNADEGSIQQQLQELMDFCTGLQRQQTEMATKIKAQDLEISNLKARIKLLKDKDRGSAEPSRDKAPIKGRSMEIGEEVQVERSTKLGSNDTKEMVNVLTPMEAVNILTSGVAAVSVSPVAG